jgi:peptidyl-prolyl cis-trans isomerase D
MSDSAAKLKIDSIENLIKGGANFATLATQLSDDKVSAEKGGDLGYFASGMMVKEFNDYAFGNPTGSRGIVKTQFGYHLIEIENQKNFVPAYKIAYLSKSIDASMETVNDAMNAANQFSGNSRTVKAFDENVIKQGLNKILSPEIRANDYNIMGLGVNRSLVRDIFEAKPQSVLEPVDMNGQYIVIAVTGVEKSGLMSASRARPMVESILRNQEKAKRIIAGLGKINSLSELATANKTFVQTADSVSFVSPMVSSVGFEPKVGGAAFNKANLNKVSSPIGGNSGVFVITALSVSASQSSAGKEEVKNSLINQARNASLSSSAQALKEKASISDNRTKFL